MSEVARILSAIEQTDANASEQLREPGADVEPPENLSIEVVSWPIFGHFEFLGGSQPTILLFLQEHIATFRDVPFG